MTNASLEMAELGIDQIDFFDLYSCFPSATIIAASEIGLEIDDLPDLTITGGLPYFGGPGNNYTMHAIAHAVARIRDNPGETGLVTGVGLYLTKHSLGIYGGREPKKPWNRHQLGPIQETIDRLESPNLCLHPEGAASVETYTVVHDRTNEPDYSVVIARLENGQRCFAQTDKDRDLLIAMEKEEFVGHKGFVHSGDNAPNIMKI
jgi:acetyl-CoA C-acetyltransferase